MSLIPKINLGAGTKRSKANMSFDSQTTANIGFVQPTMARMLIPNASINVKNRTLVRMSPLVNPTFGRLSQRDYFTFVRMSDVYKPWAEFLSGKPYSFGNTSYTPTQLPRFEMSHIVAWFLSHNAYYSFSPAEDVNLSIGWNESITQAAMDNVMLNLKSFANNFSFGSTYAPYYDESYSLDDPFGFVSIIAQGREDIEEYYDDDTQPNSFGVRKANGVEVVNNENADFTLFIDGSYLPASTTWVYQYPGESNPSTFDLSTNGVYLHIRLKPFAKNMRKIFIGCGYGFDYWDNEYYTPFKLMAFYKSWFDTFKPLRNVQFTNTVCYQLIKQLENTISIANLNTSIVDWISRELKYSFYYYTAPDYFSAALYNLGDNSLTSAQNNSVVSPIFGNITDYRNLDVDSSLAENAHVPTSDGLNNILSAGGASGVVSVVGANGVSGASGGSRGTLLNSKDNIDSFFNLNSIAIPTLLKLMRFTNKNNVIGRSIREYAKVHYGIDDIQSDNMSVTKINATRTDINFDDVMNTAASKDAFLGEYAGKGLGYKESENTYFTAKDFGFFFCMSVIVPESGYYQGTLKENKISDKFEFFTDEFDALGYEVITRGEIKNDFSKQGKTFDPSRDFNTLEGFGFIPRYTHFKVGRNIVNGDLSLGSTKNGLQGYYLDKEYPSYKVVPDGRLTHSLEAPDYLPLVVNDDIRKIDPTDNVGNYNRIFQYTDIDLDHFIIQKVFDVEVTAPWKSISDSFDTIHQDENVISRNHQ